MDGCWVSKGGEEKVMVSEGEQDVATIGGGVFSTTPSLAPAYFGAGSTYILGGFYGYA